MGIIGAPFSKGQVRARGHTAARARACVYVTLVLVLQPRDGVERGPDLIRAAGLLHKLHEQGDVTCVCAYSHCRNTSLQVNFKL